MLKPKPRLCPDRSDRAIISRASGNWAAKLFQPSFAPHQHPDQRQAAHDHGHQRHQHRINANGKRQYPADNRHAHRNQQQLHDRQRCVGLLEQHVDVAEPFEESLENAGRVVQRLGQNAFASTPRPWRRGRLCRSTVEPVFDAADGLVAHQQGHAQHDHGDADERDCGDNNEIRHALILQHDAFAEGACRQPHAGRFQPRHEVGRMPVATNLP